MKTPAEEKRIARWRDNFRYAVGRCELCGAAWMPRNFCHEILRGIYRQRALDEPSCLLVLCNPKCHLEVIHGEGWPIPMQLAALQLVRPADYSLARFNWVRMPEAPNYVTQEEVDVYLPEMRERLLTQGVKR